MTRLIIIIALAATVATAVASPSARLAALADDGLLIEDSGADGMWPASVAIHAKTVTARSAWSRYGSFSRGLDARSGLPRGWVGRAWFDVFTPSPSAQDRFQLQAARAFRALDIGIAVFYDDPLGEVDSIGRRGLRLGLRWAPGATTVIEGALSSGHWRVDESEPWDGRESSWNVRISQQVHPHAVLVAALKRGGRDWLTWSAADGGSRLHYLDTDGLHGELGLLLWPDEDSQLLIAWVQSRADAGYDDEDPTTLLHRHDRDDKGVRFSAEVRPSAWFTVRSGASYLTSSHRLWLPEIPELEQTGRRARVRVGMGASIHAGRYDLNIAWSRHQHAAEAVDMGLDRWNRLIHLELVSRF